MADNIYIRALKDSKVKKIEIKVSPRRQIVEYQGNRCYICGISLRDSMCYFEKIHGPDPKTKLPSEDMRAVCASCRFKVKKI